MADEAKATQVAAMSPTPVASPALNAPASAQAQAQATQATTADKTLGNTDASGTTKNVPDVQFFGDGDTFELICKASSQKEGWMKSTKACTILGVGCIVQVTTQQRNIDGTYSIAEALAFVPGVKVVFDTDASCKRFMPY